MTSRRKKHHKKAIHQLIQTAKTAQWCRVDTDNRFTFLHHTFVIADTVDEYRVFHKAGEVDDYTNEAMMEKILVILEEDGTLRYFNQAYIEVDDVSVCLTDGPLHAKKGAVT